MSQISQAKSPTVKIKVDGREIQVPGDRPVLYGMLEAGFEVPHYCYHPGLSIAGNCRMCLVKIVGMPKLQISCNTFPKEGMEILSGTDDEVSRARRSVLEFLLANHPLDCPVCDQAGECWLQDFAYRHGRSVGRFREPKVTKHTKRLGDGSDVRLWGERCIACSRCVRFCDEISGGGEIALVARGDHVTVDVHPDVALTNPLAGNVVDVCPVGALVSDDFLFQARVWELSIVDSVCPACSKGCNITVESHKGRVRRIRPRPNLEVNGYWMCDHGRFAYKMASAPDRLVRPWIREGNRIVHPGLEEAEKRAGEALRGVREAHGGTSVALVADLWMTNEELLVFSDLARALPGSALGVLAGPVRADEVFPGFTIDGDKNPNREGARRILGTEAVDRGLTQLADLLAAGGVKGIFIHAGLPSAEFSDDFLKALERLELVVYHGLENSPAARMAHIGLPSRVPYEKNGTFTNALGLTQRVRKGVDPETWFEPDSAAIQRLVATVQPRRDEFREPLSDLALTKRLPREVAAFADLVPGDLDRPGPRPNYQMSPSPLGLAAGRFAPREVAR